MIDSHCHLDLPALAKDSNNILSACHSLGVSRILVPGLSMPQFDALMRLQKQWQTEAPNIRIDIALGLHPYFLTDLQADITNEQFQQQFVELAHLHQDKLVAIGECGLDKHINVPFAQQTAVLSMQIEVARQLNKPLILHHRQSHNDIIRLLKQTRFGGGGVIHAFSGSEQIANTYIDMGFKLGVGGTISYPRAVKTRNSIRKVDMQHLLLETDAPDMPLNGYQGQVNTPARLPQVAKYLAELKGVSFEQVVACTNQNYQDVFMC
ncbi:MAG: TatD family hydrolase [Glaciecola sp.]